MVVLVSKRGLGGSSSWDTEDPRGKRKINGAESVTKGKCLWIFVQGAPKIDKGHHPEEG